MEQQLIQMGKTDIGYEKMQASLENYLKMLTP
jgi:hypothetical protein